MSKPANDTFETSQSMNTVTRAQVGRPPSTTRWSLVAKTNSLKYPASNGSTRPPGGWPMKAWEKTWCRCVSNGSNYHYIDDDARWPGMYTTDIRGFQTYECPSNAAMVDSLLPFSPGLQFSAEQAARTRFLNELGMKKFDLGVAALELKETAGLVTELAKSMVQGILSASQAKRRGRQAANRFFRDMQTQGSFENAVAHAGRRDVDVLNRMRDRWMQYQFGVRPLLKDIDDATTYLADLVLRDQTPVSVHLSKGAMRDKLYDGPTKAFTAWLITPELHESCHVNIAGTYRYTTEGVSPLTELGLDNPMSIGWEVLRLSWMVDYVVGIGDWLQSFTATNGLVQAEACMSTTRRITSRNVAVKRDPLPPHVRRKYVSEPKSNGTLYLERGSFVRILLPHVLPAVVPSLKKELGLVQLANSLFALSNFGKPTVGQRI